MFLSQFCMLCPNPVCDSRWGHSSVAVLRTSIRRALWKTHAHPVPTLPNKASPCRTRMCVQPKRECWLFWTGRSIAEIVCCRTSVHSQSISATKKWCNKRDCFAALFMFIAIYSHHEVGIILSIKKQLTLLFLSTFFYTSSNISSQQILSHCCTTPAYAVQSEIV